MAELSRDLDLLFEIGSLRNVVRGWQQHLGTDCASVLEHTTRVAWLAMIIARREGGCDEGKVLKMALLHDLAETRTSDHSYVQKVYVSADEKLATDDALAGTAVAGLAEVLAEFEAQQTLEAKVVKDADNLDIDIELRELAERGSQLPAKWAPNRRKVRDTKLHTEAARQLWDATQTADPAAWHLAANKHVRPERAR